MSFDLTNDQVALRDGIRALLEGKVPMARVREGFDRALHGELAAAGVFSLRADGFTWADAAIVFEELGRALVPGPLVWSFAQQGIVAGVDGGAAPGPALVDHLGEGGALDTVLVLTDTGVTRHDPTTLGAQPVARPLDPLTPAARVSAWPAGQAVADAAAARALRAQGALLTAAFCVGMADALTERAVTHTQTREQFGRPIGAFQAVKHLCADMAVRAEVARAATYAAACTMDDPEVADLRRAVSGAKLLAGRAAVSNGRAATQVLGGMGFTWEVDVHLYLKRAWVLDSAFGSSRTHADAVAATLAAPA